MKSLKIQGGAGDSTILIGERFQDLARYVDVEKTVLITDYNVGKLYLKDLPPLKTLEIGCGETVKNLDTVREIYGRLVALEADRTSFIVGFGGGIVCDVTGFVASTYLRGVRFGFVSSTLLSQVDASVGGKNGVNFGGYKNMVGVFNQPEFVICDMNLLRTLPEREILCGFAEIIKHGALADADLFTYIEEHYQEALALDPEVMERLVYESVVIKSSIVNRDAKEKGERRRLNLGHTFGHAIETVTGVHHGEAVSVGMMMAAALSEKRGSLSSKEMKRMEALLKNMKLPVRLQVEGDKVLDALRKDKKREGDSIHFVLLHGLGNAVTEMIPMKELEDFWAYWIRGCYKKGGER